MSLSEYSFKDEFHEMLQSFIGEYDTEAFWDGLVDRLADRDFEETYGDAAKRIDQNARFEKPSALVDKYEAEIEEHGIDRLNIVETRR